MEMYLKDYQPPCFEIESIELHFNLDERKTTVTSHLELKRMSKGALELDGVNLRLIQLLVDDQEYNQYLLENEKLILPEAPDRFRLTTVVEIDPGSNTSLDGLYKSNGIFCTQCEAQGFRKITYFLDRPDSMSRFTTTLEADIEKHPVLLSNGNRIASEILDNGRHRATWQDPFKKPCYLFALVAGNLGVIKEEYETWLGQSPRKVSRKINLEIYAKPGLQDRCRYAIQALKKSMRWDEDRFGREYDLDNYMIVAVDDFNMGAMENKGLNIFNSSMVFADTNSATDSDFHRIESVIGHEYFHNWTGNRITCRDWFQLTLKEGLTVFRDREFSADMHSRAVKRIEDVKILRTRQFPEDAGPLSHPIKPQSAMAIDNFYTPTIYEKGAEVVGMIETIVGRQGFRKGMDLYFETFDGQAITTEDFLWAHEKANNCDLTQFERWYHQSGTPIVEIEESFTDGKYKLKLSQSKNANTKPSVTTAEVLGPLHIPFAIGLIDENKRDLFGTQVLHLTKQEQEFVFTGFQTKPLLSPLRGFSAPVILDWNVSDEHLLFLMKYDTDPFNRWEAFQKLAVKELQKLISQHMTNKPMTPSESFVNSYSEMLKNLGNELQFEALLFELPSTVVLAQTMDVFEPASEFSARRCLKSAISQRHTDLIFSTYNRFKSIDPFSKGSVTAGQRALKNKMLDLLTNPQIAFDQYKNALNMTDKMAAMGCLADQDTDHSQEALGDFYKKWHKDPVVIDKWFQIQALSLQDSSFEMVQRLENDPAFNNKNPNKVYSLISAWANGNLVRFHDRFQETYPWIAKKIIELDGINPQVATHVNRCWSLKKRLSPLRQDIMTQAIKTIANHPGLSKNTSEQIQKSLEF